MDTVQRFIRCVSITSILLAIAALGSGLLAAYYWFKASNIETDPGWRSGPPQSAADPFKPIEPVDPSRSQEGWTMAIMNANRASSALNQKAAIWTATAVVLSALSSVFGALAGCF